MCHTERYQEINGIPKTWTFRTVYRENVTRDNVQTMHFDCVSGECSLAIAWLRYEVISVKLQVTSSEEIPSWDTNMDGDMFLRLYRRLYPGLRVEDMPPNLNSFFLSIPEMINLISEMDGDILKIKEDRLTALNQQLTAAC